VLQALDRGQAAGIPPEMCLEGPTRCDCLIECQHAIIWVEGKRNDWLAACTTWDLTRDQLSRNLDAASIIAAEKKKEFCVLICHEQNNLKYHESLLIDGYRKATWRGGFPHLGDVERANLGQRIATLTWQEISEKYRFGLPA
jgi:hypothetical protein